MSIEDLTASLEADPSNWEARQALVEALVAEGQNDRAIEVVNQGEAIPREPGPWLAAAKCYAAVGAVEQARGLVGTALEIDPDYEPAQKYRDELEASAAPTPVALTAEDVEEEEPVAAVAATETPAPDTEVAATIPEVDHESDSPISLPKVSFSNEEMDALHAAEEEARRQREAAIRRDKLNSLTITVLLHVVIIVLLTLVATQTPQRVPPQIVASSMEEPPEDQIEDVTLEKPTVDPTTAVNSAVTDIVSVSATSDFSMSNVDVEVADVAVETGMAFQPSMSAAMPTSSESKMMFGQPLEGEVLGVILDVSGSMAEYLPQVVREVDKNFQEAPIVYVRNMLIRERNDDGEVRLIVPDEVKPYDKELKTRTPYWFLWHDLPRKAPQRYVDRLIETFKTRPNQFLTVGRWDRSRVESAIDFLMEQEIDSLYVFSDFEDFVNEDMALTIGQKLGRRKIRTYLQPAEKGTEFLDIMTNKIANRTLGRRLPSLVSILGGSSGDDEPDPLVPDSSDEETMPDVEVTYAKPREQPYTDVFYSRQANKNWYVVHRINTSKYDAIFYGPEARAHIFLKNAEGKYIQNPIRFHYHSRKVIPDHPDPRYRNRARKFLRVEEKPAFDEEDEEIVWKMVLEDELKFQVHLYLNDGGMYATYTSEPPKDGTNDWDHVHFTIPALARERKDRYYGFDFPEEGHQLDAIRKATHPNTFKIDLPRQLRDQRGEEWKRRGFEPGYNTRHFDTLIRRMPYGIRDMVVKGPSFGPRVFHARTTSGKVLLHGGSHRPDFEPWEGFHARLSRIEEERESFTKTEAIEIEIE